MKKLFFTAICAMAFNATAIINAKSLASDPLNLSLTCLATAHESVTVTEEVLERSLTNEEKNSVIRQQFSNCIETNGNLIEVRKNN